MNSFSRPALALLSALAVASPSGAAFRASGPVGAAPSFSPAAITSAVDILQRMPLSPTDVGRWIDGVRAGHAAMEDADWKEGYGLVLGALGRSPHIDLGALDPRLAPLVARVRVYAGLHPDSRAALTRLEEEHSGGGATGTVPAEAPEPAPQALIRVTESGIELADEAGYRKWSARFRKAVERGSVEAAAMMLDEGVRELPAPEAARLYEALVSMPDGGRKSQVSTRLYQDHAWGEGEEPVAGALARYVGSLGRPPSLDLLQWSELKSPSTMAPIDHMAPMAMYESAMRPRRDAQVRAFRDHAEKAASVARIASAAPAAAASSEEARTYLSDSMVALGASWRAMNAASGLLSNQGTEIMDAMRGLFREQVAAVRRMVDEAGSLLTGAPAAELERALTNLTGAKPGSRKERKEARVLLARLSQLAQGHELPPLEEGGASRGWLAMLVSTVTFGLFAARPRLRAALPPAADSAEDPELREALAEVELLTGAELSDDELTARIEEAARKAGTE